MGIYVVVRAIVDGTQLITLVSAFNSPRPDADVYLTIASSITAHIGIGVALLVGASALGRFMFPGEQDVTIQIPTQIGGLALRIFGVVLWTWALGTLPTALLRGLVDKAGAGALTAVAILLMILGTWLFLRGESVSRWLLRTPRSESTSSMAALQAIAISITGLVVLAGGLPDVVTICAVWIARHFPDVDETSFGGLREWPASFSAFARVVLGITLFFGGGGLAWLWRRTRTAGLPASPTRDPA
jgi:hypothetical protein